MGSSNMTRIRKKCLRPEGGALAGLPNWNLDFRVYVCTCTWVYSNIQSSVCSHSISRSLRKDLTGVNWKESSAGLYLQTEGESHYI